MVTLNILLILLSFINSLKKEAKVNVTQGDIGVVALSDDPGDYPPTPPGKWC
jgi:hypothetical protein